MVASACVAFLHFVAVFGIVATLFFEWFLLSEAPSHVEARKLQNADRWYGIFAGVLLVVGFLRVFYFEKGKAFYFDNPFFRLKLTLFIVLGLVSIYPTLKFIGWRKEMGQGQAPTVPESQRALLRNILSVELVVLLGIALCASLMARGVSL